MEIPVQKEACGCVHGWWGDPGFRVSHELAAWQTRDVHETKGHDANIGCISYNKSIRSRKVVSALIPSKRALSKCIGFDAV